MEKAKMKKPLPTQQAKIILLFGASGSGKSALFSEFETIAAFSIHKKGSTRPKKQYDGNEITHVVEKELRSQYNYIYSRYGHFYGLQKCQFETAIQEEKIHFAICNDIDAIKDIKSDYQDLVTVICLLYDAPRKVIEDIQKEKDITDDEIKVRLEKIDSLNKIFIEHSSLFDGVIVSKYGFRPKLMVNQLMGILREESGYNNLYDNEIISAVFDIRRDISLLKTHIFPQNQVNDTIQKGYLFVIMPINGDPLLEDTFDAIKTVSEKLNLNAERIDDIPSKIISEKILSSIRIAEFIVADVTLERPNCYYEVGYAHALGKNTILIAKEGTEVHFDIKGHQILFYKNAVRLKELLESHIVKMRKRENENT